MRTKYTDINDARKARIADGNLYVMQTNKCYGMLEQGGYAGRVYKMPYNGTLEDAQITNDHGINDLDRCIEYGNVARQGRLIR